MSQGVKATLRSISTVIVILVALVAFFISGIRLFGFQVYGVLSGSMEPSYPVGSLVYVKQVDPAELKIRDVITYSINRNTIVTHRIVEIVPDENNPTMMRYRTKGDANENADTGLVSAGSIIGKVAFCIPHLGNVASYIQNPPGLYVAIGFGILLIVVVIMTDSATSTGKEEQKSKNLLASIPGLSPLLMKLGLLKPQPELPQGQASGQPTNSGQTGYPVQTAGYPTQQNYPGTQQPQQAVPYPQQGMQQSPQDIQYPYSQQGMQPPQAPQYPYPQQGVQQPSQARQYRYPQQGMQLPQTPQYRYPQPGMQQPPQAAQYRYPQPGTQQPPQAPQYRYPQQGAQQPPQAAQQRYPQPGMQQPPQPMRYPAQAAQQPYPAAANTPRRRAQRPPLDTPH